MSNQIWFNSIYWNPPNKCSFSCCETVPDIAYPLFLTSSNICTSLRHKITQFLFGTGVRGFLLLSVVVERGTYFVNFYGAQSRISLSLLPSFLASVFNFRRPQMELESGGIASPLCGKLHWKRARRPKRHARPLKREEGSCTNFVWGLF